MATKVGQGKPGTRRYRGNDRIIGAAAGRSAAPSDREELDAKIQGLLSAGALSGEDLRSLIAALEERYGEDLRRQLREFIRRKGGGTPGFDAEDAVQEMWTKASRGLAAGKGRQLGQIGAWLLRIAKNCVIDHLRQRVSEMAVLRGLFGIADRTFPDPAEAGSDREEDEMLQEVLKQLDDVEWMILRSSFFDGLSSFDIAEKYEIPASTVRGKRRRALKRLRPLIDRGGDAAC